MKKEYIKPTADAMAFYTETLMLGGSLVTNENETTDEYFGNEAGGWNSSNWSGGEEE